MLRTIPLAVARDHAHAAAASPLEPRLAALAAPLRKLSAAQVRTAFQLPDGTEIIKTTLSVCPDCLDHVRAAVYAERGRVFMVKRCERHGRHVAVVENDERYYRLSTKDRWGRAYDLSRLDAMPAYDGGCCDGGTCGTADASADPWLHDLVDQRGNKSCTVLVEVTDACNLACRVCYADARGDRVMPLAKFEQVVRELLAVKGRLDSIQVTGGEAALHPDFWRMIDFLHGEPRIARIYLPTNGIAFDSEAAADRLAAYRDKLIVLLQFDGGDAKANATLRRARPERVRERLLARLERRSVPMQLTMTLAAGLNEQEIAWVVRQGVRHRNVRLVALQPAFFAGRYDVAHDPLARATLSDAVKGVALGLTRGRASDFVPIPCSHPNCGWVNLYVRRFGFFFNLSRHVDLERVMGSVAYKTQLGTKEVRAIVGTGAKGWLQKAVAAVGRGLVRPRDVFGIVIKPFMDRYTYDQDRVSACCHHIVDTQGTLTSFCEYNVRKRDTDSWASRPALEGHRIPRAVASG